MPVLFVASIQSGCLATGSLAVSPTSVNFGNVVVGSSSSQSVTITNSSTLAFAITGAAVEGTGFELKGLQLPLTLAPGQSATFTTGFAPVAIGDTSGRLLITKSQVITPQLQNAITATKPSSTTQQATIAMKGNGVPVIPSITTQPVSQTVTAGQAATFLVAASGQGHLTYQWRRNGTPITGATSPSYNIPATTASDSGSQFTVVVSNSKGDATSAAATLTVTAAATPPSITMQPVSQTVPVGKTATFSVISAGAGPLSYQWKKNGTAVSGATLPIYTTPVAATSDSGSQFTVVVSNLAGNANSSIAILTVTSAIVIPSITSQPANQTVTIGQSATFLVAASGTGPLSYQWQKNGTAIGGATSSAYTTPVTTSSDSGSQFAVAVSNSSGTVTSSAATLTVNATGQLTASITTLNYGSIAVGSSSTLPVTLTNVGGTSISVLSVTLSGAGVSVGGVSSGQILAGGNSMVLNVTFAPSASGTLNGSVSIASNATNSTMTISLSGTAVQPASHSATLTLSPNSSNVAGYNIYRSPISNGPYTRLNAQLVTSTTYIDSPVVANQTYYYVATSVDTAGTETTYSNQMSTTIPTP